MAPPRAAKDHALRVLAGVLEAASQSRTFVGSTREDREPMPGELERLIERYGIGALSLLPRCRVVVGLAYSFFFAR